jgi:hypothetical protein
MWPRIKHLNYLASCSLAYVRSFFVNHIDWSFVTFRKSDNNTY